MSCSQQTHLKAQLADTSEKPDHALPRKAVLLVSLHPVSESQIMNADKNVLPVQY